MTVSDQVQDPNSRLNRFLDDALPHRGVIAEEWSHRIEWASPLDAVLDLKRARHVGKALEIRIGLDLADHPGYWGLLSFLPAADCSVLLSAAGFGPVDLDHMPSSDTTDPLLLSWTRRAQPLEAADDAQCAALGASLGAAAMDLVAHGWGDSYSAQFRRSFFLGVRSGSTAFLEADDGNPTFRGLHQMWEGYLHHSRRLLAGLGEPVVLSPPLALGFGTADAVIGRTLVEIKTSVRPAEQMSEWLNQILAYVLLDRLDLFRLDAVALYLGWPPTFLHLPITEFLATATSGITPGLSKLRERFQEAMQRDLDDAATEHGRKRYGIPSRLP